MSVDVFADVKDTVELFLGHRSNFREYFAFSCDDLYPNAVEKTYELIIALMAAMKTINDPVELVEHLTDTAFEHMEEMLSIGRAMVVDVIRESGIEVRMG